MDKCQICKSEQNCMKLFLHRKYWDAFYKKLELSLDKKNDKEKNWFNQMSCLQNTEIIR